MAKKRDGEAKDFSDEIHAYALKNSLEFGKTSIDRVLPKLFQHGLSKKDVGAVVPKIKEIVDKINKWSEKERKMQYGRYGGLVLERDKSEDSGLAQIPNIRPGTKFRIAPFPSGALHLGNAKTFLLNALYAERYGGKLILVIDDTIGSEKKPIEKEAYELIKDGLKYLKIDYEKKIIYKSDRLSLYYQYAKKLIEKDKAYVCYCSQSEFQKLKEQRKECGCRNLPKDVQLLRWKEFFTIEEGHAVLRLKTDMNHSNPAFRDRVLFKISDREHPRVKKKYRVWPTLEMSWAIDDHELGITHIIRGNELMIETEVENYIWDIFGWKHVEVIHTGIVNIEGAGAKISKSKARDEVLSGRFTGWDDPRTWSIQSLERRGISAEAIRQFVREIGLNKQNITIPIENLYAINRRMLDSDADRYFFVANPKEIKVNEIPKELREVEVLVHPEKVFTRKLKTSKNIYVSLEDFEKLKGKEVRLLHLVNLNLKEESKVTDIENKDIPRIQWVSDLEKIKTRILMPNGEWISGFADSGIKKLKVGDIIQFERFGFVRYDGSKQGIKEFWFAHR